MPESTDELCCMFACCNCERFSRYHEYYSERALSNPYFVDKISWCYPVMALSHCHCDFSNWACSSSPDQLTNTKIVYWSRMFVAVTGEVCPYDWYYLSVTQKSASRLSPREKLKSRTHLCLWNLKSKVSTYIFLVGLATHGRCSATWSESTRLPGVVCVDTSFLNTAWGATSTWSRDALIGIWIFKLLLLRRVTDSTILLIAGIRLRFLEVCESS